MSFSRIAALGALISSVAAHGVATGIIADGVYHAGFSQDFIYMSNPPAVVGWTTTVQDRGFVGPADYAKADIACHHGGAPAGLSAPVTAGSSVDVHWSEWPESHHGPVIGELLSFVYWLR